MRERTEVVEKEGNCLVVCFVITNVNGNTVKILKIGTYMSEQPV